MGAHGGVFGNVIVRLHFTGTHHVFAGFRDIGFGRSAHPDLAIKEAPQRCGQAFIGEILVGEQRVSAIRGNLLGMHIEPIGGSSR